MRSFTLIALFLALCACLSLSNGAAINNEAAAELLEVDAGDLHAEESEREARQIGFGGFIGPAYGGPYYGGYGGGYGGYRGGYGGYRGGYGGYGGYRGGYGGYGGYRGGYGGYGGYRGGFFG